MIVTEFYMTREDGVRLIRTFSDNGRMIERDGVLYEEAIDPEDVVRTYVETDQDIAGADATESDYVAALRTLGVDVSE